MHRSWGWRKTKFSLTLGICKLQDLSKLSFVTMKVLIHILHIAIFKFTSLLLTITEADAKA